MNAGSSRTEAYFTRFGDTYWCTRAIDRSQACYKPNDVYYFAGENQMKFLQIFRISDDLIYVTDNRKDYEDKKVLNAI